MFAKSELLDLDTWAAVMKSAPKVTGVSYGHALEVVKSLNVLSVIGKSGMKDVDGRVYWEATLKEVASDCGMDLKLVGRACREMGLTLWRKSDGYHVAWSSQQLKILVEYFKIE
jgi:hypothetical protein